MKATLLVLAAVDMEEARPHSYNVQIPLKGR